MFDERLGVTDIRSQGSLNRDGASFLLEVGMEELPAQFAESAVEQLSGLARRILDEWGLAYADVRAFVTPRRLALMVEALSEQQPDLVEEVKGPGVRMAYDAEGAPTKALLGFMRGQGVSEANVFRRELNGTEYVYARKFRSGQRTEMLLQDLIERVLGGLTFNKPMRWGDLTLRFARPVRWLVALYGEQAVDFRFAGLTSGRTTWGHRTLGRTSLPGGESLQASMTLVRLNGADEYIEALRLVGVVVDQEERREMILAQMAELEGIAGGKAEVDEDLLTEIVHLVEFPTVFTGKVDEGYLSLPDEVITTPMKQHQRYFPVRDLDGKLLPVFFGVRNGGREALEVVVQGNERVLKARLEDAAFYFREDVHRGLDDYVRDLDGVVFHERLGSVGQRVDRLCRLAGALAEKAGLAPVLREMVLRAAALAKADLASKMVYDFPELQGIMGGYYAALQGDSAEVALAVREHYRPRAAGDALPESVAGRVLSLADRLDALAGFFGAGIQPTGSQDPFGLRRQAQGLVALLMDEATPVEGPLAELIGMAWAGFVEQGIFLEIDVREAKSVPGALSGELVRTVEDFCWQRVRYAWLEGGRIGGMGQTRATDVSYDVADAILARSTDPFGNVCLSRKGPRSLTRQAVALGVCRERHDFEGFLNAYVRCVNLSRKTFLDDGGLSPDLNYQLLSHEAERVLLAGLDHAEPMVSACLDKDDFLGAYEAGLGVVSYIETLFDAVMIMDPDPELKQARLALLRRCVAVLGGLGDLTLLAG
ncbi:MAG: glycine--tRNA ligase subunit beta [Peptococcaceae bacterium]|nr:glycine--tRNA ligase subunit beta [Peptococcaceae bacterium]